MGDYYDHYGNTSNGDILYIIVAVFAILGLILFFKIWTMTNHVKNIQNSLNRSHSKLSNYIDSIVIRDKEIASQYLKMEILKEFEQNANSNNISMVWENTYNTIIEKYKLYYDYAGIEMPDYSKYQSISEAFRINTLDNFR